MKIPKVEKLTPKQRMKLRQALALFPDKQLVGGEARKPTKRERDLQEAESRGYSMGRAQAREQFEAESKRKDTEYEQKRKAVNLEALKTMRDAYSAFGQMMGELSRAIQAVNGQL